MHEQPFELSCNPFAATPDPRFFYAGRRTREALARLTYGIKERCGFATLLGEVGTGKTTVARKLIEEMQPTARTLLINHTTMMRHDMLRMILHDLGVENPGTNRVEMIRKIEDLLTAEAREGKEPTFLVFDEAQNFRTPLFEEIRLLSNLETEQGKLLQILLVGQPELGMKLQKPSLQAINQRIVVRARVEPLTAEETAEFVLHRLRVAGRATNDLFTPCGLDRVYEASGGVPRVINTVCEHALLNAYAVGKRIINATTVQAGLVDCGMAAPVEADEDFVVIDDSDDSKDPVAPRPEPASTWQPWIGRGLAVAGLSALALGASLTLMSTRDTADSVVAANAAGAVAAAQAPVQATSPAPSAAEPTEAAAAPAVQKKDENSEEGIVSDWVDEPETVTHGTGTTEARALAASTRRRAAVESGSTLSWFRPAQDVQLSAAVTPEPRTVAPVEPTSVERDVEKVVEAPAPRALPERKPFYRLPKKVASREVTPRAPERAVTAEARERTAPARAESRVEPVAITRVEPDLTRRDAKRSGSESVALKVLVNEKGNVVRVVVDGGSTGSSYEAAAIDAVLRWKYRPAREQGKPVRAWVTENFGPIYEAKLRK